MLCKHGCLLLLNVTHATHALRSCSGGLCFPGAGPMNDQDRGDHAVAQSNGLLPGRIVAALDSFALSGHLDSDR